MLYATLTLENEYVSTVKIHADQLIKQLFQQNAFSEPTIRSNEAAKRQDWGVQPNFQINRGGKLTKIAIVSIVQGQSTGLLAANWRMVPVSINRDVEVWASCPGGSLMNLQIRLFSM